MVSKSSSGSTINLRCQTLVGIFTNLVFIGVSFSFFIVLFRPHLGCVLGFYCLLVFCFKLFNHLIWVLVNLSGSLRLAQAAHFTLTIYFILFFNCHTEPWIQRCKSPVGNPQLIQFSREIIDLLKSQPSCIMPISKFIPSYHHHFAKQCRVSDYGFSKLLELLEAVPHVLQVFLMRTTQWWSSDWTMYLFMLSLFILYVFHFSNQQILGMGTKRLLTLTHRAQVKRFTQDLLKLLKFQASKQVAIKDFMQAYHW